MVVNELKFLKIHFHKIRVHSRLNCFLKVRSLIQSAGGFGLLRFLSAAFCKWRIPVGFSHYRPCAQ